VNHTLVVNMLRVLWELFGLGEGVGFISETDCIHEFWTEAEETVIQ
jgi:hypothetical protein